MPRTKDATAAKLGRRKAALKKKAQELATRCNVEVAVLCAYPGDDPLMWPSNQEVSATVRRYNALPPENREKNTEDSADQAARRLDEELDKLVRAQEGGVAGALGSWDGSLEGMSVEELRELLDSIDGSLAAARSRGAPEQLPQNGDSIMPADESAEETSLSLTATSANNGERPQRGGADEEGDESALPEEENPTKSPNAAAPLVADQVTAENSEPATAEGAGNGVRLREADAGGDNLELPLEESPGATNAAPSDADDAAAGQDEGDDVQMLQPRGDADADADEAEWMRDLVDALKGIPPPPDAAAYWSETEYLYMGRGFAMERDAYDFIFFDLGMPPPYIGPDLPDSDDDEPVQLWSWE